jgi:hypothetical protein
MLHAPPDHLVRSLATAGSRRHLLGALAGAPLLGALLAVLAPEDAEARKRRRRRKRRCKPKRKAKVCAGKCGLVKNKQTCGKRVNCGSCDCDPPCGECFTCQGNGEAPGTCVPQAGAPCGEPTCANGVSYPPGRCNGNGVCQPAAPITCAPYTQCDGNICATTCTGDSDCTNHCCNGTCQECCDNDQCTDPAKPYCADGTCSSTCTAHAQCGPAAICLDGVCQACDVTCAAADHVCDQSQLQPAVAAGGTVYVCPGRYTGNLTLSDDVTIIGAGQGADAAANTILDAQNNGRVVHNTDDVTATLHQVWITGGRGPDARGGAGVLNDGTLTLTSCTISHNTFPPISGSGQRGGGILTYAPGELTMIDCSVHNNTIDGNGGMGAGIYLGGPTTLTNCTIGPDNRVLNGGTIGAGGGIRLTDANSGPLTLNNCTITGNSAVRGGGISNQKAQVTINGGSVTGNIATGAGDIYNAGQLILIDNPIIGDCENTDSGCGCPGGNPCA